MFQISKLDFGQIEIEQGVTLDASDVSLELVLIAEILAKICVHKKEEEQKTDCAPSAKGPNPFKFGLSIYAETHCFKSNNIRFLTV